MSSSEVAVSVRDLSKSYTISHNAEKHSTAAEALMHRLKNPRQHVEKETFWALKDVNFDIQKGEVVGIIGRNGAGKSTLLKVLSRITEPTTGQIDLYGRVGSLLEVGTGFHPELTGRENIYLNGAILGMNRKEIAREFDAIVDFSGTEKFLDTPVKRYSSGMYVRLAFAVAAHLNPEILIVDEVLAVGDAEFQKKCMGKMKDVAHSGRTILFVSHNMTAIAALCSHVVWMDGGKVRDYDTTRRIVSSYMSASYAQNTDRSWEISEDAPGNNQVRIWKARVGADERPRSEAVTVRTPLVIEFEYENYVPGACLNLSIVVTNEEGAAVFNSFPITEPEWNGRPFPAGVFRSSCYVPGDLLNDGTYSVDLYVVRDYANVVYHHAEILSFEVQDSPDLRGAWHGDWIGAVRPNLRWKTQLLREPAPVQINETAVLSRG